MIIEIETPDGGVRALTLTRALTYVDVLTYRAREANWPDADSVGACPDDATPEQQLAWYQAAKAALPAMLERSAAALPDQLEWLARVLSPADVAWLADEATPAVVTGVCQALVSSREVPAATAKKFRVRPLS